MDDAVDLLEAARKPLLVTHRHADRDALGSAIGLRALLGRGTVCTPDGIAAPARSLLDATGTDPVVDPALESYDRVVVVDAPASDRIAPVDPANPILIDHHQPDDLAAHAAAAVVDTEAGATAELVARLATAAEWPVTPAAALPLLVGLLDDTDFLRGAAPPAVHTAVDLAAALGDRAGDLPTLIERTPAEGEQTARAIGLLRASGYRAGDWFVAVTRVGAHEAAVANTLRSEGIGLALVCTRRSEFLRVTARASPALAERVSLGGTLLPELAAAFDGEAGGHDGAGVARLPGGTQEAVEEAVIEALEGHLGVTFAPL